MGLAKTEKVVVVNRIVISPSSLCAIEELQLK